MTSSAAIMERIVAGVAMLIAFLVMASIFVPEPSTAHEAEHPEHGPPRGHGSTVAEPEAAEHSEAVSTDPHAGLIPLGTLEHGTFHVEIYATESGPRYSIYETNGGAELGVLMTAEQVERHFPELPLPTMEFGTSTPLMLLPPEAEPWPR